MIATIIILALLFMDLGATLVKHGDIKESKYNFWIALLADGITILLLWQAGLFDNFK